MMLTVRIGAGILYKRSMREHSGVMKSILNLELVDGIMDVCICQKLSNYSLKNCVLPYVNYTAGKKNLRNGKDAS